MTLPASGTISMATVNTEVGAAAGTPRGLGWIRDNSFYAYTSLGSIYGLTWFQAVSSKGSISRTALTTTTNCAQNCASQTNPGGYTYSQQNCTAIAATNCNQCGTSHGTYLQGNCNCNCNCYVCNCAYNNCNCDCNCNCTCDCGTCCFPAGELVLMADGSLKPVEQLQPGDWLMGYDGRPVELSSLDLAPLDPNRAVIEIDGLLATEDHAIWVRDVAGEGFWVFSRDVWLRVAAGGKIALKDNERIKTSAPGQPIEVAHLEGWRSVVPRVVDPRYQEQLYAIRTASGTPVIVGGYVVTSITAEQKFEDANGFDYSAIQWDNARIPQ